MKAEFHFAGDPVAFALPETIPATKQDIFDRVVWHYRKQPYRCADMMGACLHRYGNDKCWVGALMSDEEAARALLMGVKMLIDTGASPTWMVPHRDFLADIQAIHDTTTNWDEGRMPMVLEMFAAERGLVMPD